MKRRDFLRRVGPAAAAGLAAGCVAKPVGTGGAGRPLVKWRMASSYPPSLDTIFGTAKVFAQRLAALTDGLFEVRVFSPGELMPALQVLDGVQKGAVECGHTAGYYYTGKNPVFAFDTSVPFGLTTRQQLAWLYAGGGLDLLRKAYADFNVINFPAGSTGAQMGGWFRREVNTLADLKGLKMRIPGLGGEVMAKLGVTVQSIPGSDLYMALERGAIDATEWVGPYDDEKLGFHQVAKNYYFPGWWEPGPVVPYLVNRDAWAKLPSSYQAAWEVASAESCQYMTNLYDKLNPEALFRLVNAGVQLRRFPDEMMAAAEKIAFELMEGHAAKEAGYRELYSHWKSFRAGAYRWFSTCELNYAQFAFPRG